MKQPALIVDDLVDGADVRVIQSGRRPGLAHQPFGTIGQELAIEELQRNGAAQARVDGTVDLPMPPVPSTASTQ